MTSTSTDSLLKLVYETGGVRADPDTRERLDGLVADGFLYQETGPAASPECPTPEPIYRITEEGKRLVESFFG